MAVNLDQIDFAAIQARERRRQGRGKLALVAAILISAIWVVPFYYVITSVFKSTEEYSLHHPLSLPDGVAPVVDNAVTALTSILEPIMIVILALVVGSVVFALFLPLIKVIQEVGQ